MEIEVKENAVFQPIELKLVIETEEELCNLWHRINVNSAVINSASEGIKHEANNDDNKLWKELDNLITKYNLKR